MTKSKALCDHPVTVQLLKMGPKATVSAPCLQMLLAVFGRRCLLWLHCEQYNRGESSDTQTPRYPKSVPDDHREPSPGK